jgi:flagellar hook assembly protein FlgD
MFWIVLVLVICFGTGFLYAGGTPEPPKMLDKSGPQHFSPNGDGIRDEATIEFEVELYVKSNSGGYIPEAVLQIIDSDGQVLKELKKTEKSDVGWPGSWFQGHQKFTKTGWFGWDGTREDGTLAPEGGYDFKLTVKDASNKPVEVSLNDAFVIDNTPPSISKIVVDTPFSPNGDGYKDTLVVKQEGSEEAIWVGTLENLSGVVLKEFRWENSRPLDFEWDGTEEDGSKYSYEVYQYRLRGTDRAGNSIERIAEERIVLDRIETPIELAVDTSHFSPNGDGIKETVTISLSTKVVEGIKSWSVSIGQVSGPTRRTFKGESEVPPEEIVFDGTDDAGGAIPEGDYRISFQIEYVKGNRGEAQTVVTLDVTKPVVEVTLTNPYFSPNGDGSKDNTEIILKANEIVTAVGRVVAPDGQTVFEASAEESGGRIILDGIDPTTGRPVPEGTYRLLGIFTDRAGNTETGEVELVVDVTPPVIQVSADPEVFSPNGDGYKDTVTVTMSASEPVYGTASVIDPGGRTIISTNVPTTTGEEIVLEGLSSPSMPLVNGVYRITGRLEDFAGNRVEPEPLLVTRDDRDTPLEIAVGEKSFSPNQDGTRDTVEIVINTPVNEGIKEWSLSFEDNVGRSVRTVTGRDRFPDRVVWDGSTDSGIAPEGYYSAKLEAEWETGSKKEAKSEEFLLDVTPPTVSVSTTASPFVKEDGEIEGKAFITLKVEDQSGIESWNLDILDTSGDIVRSYTGQGDPSDKITWEGESETKREYEIEQELVLRVEVVDKLGNKREFEQPLTIDVIVYRKGDKLYLIVPNIIFEAYQHELDSRGKEWEQKNWTSIKRVMNVMRKYPDYGVLLEGHALNIYRGKKNEEKEEKILGPLTERRADAVKQALKSIGLEEERIQTEAFGGHFPIVSTADRQIWWKNRRVEFLLTPPE